jgi:hypothetical protein
MDVLCDSTTVPLVLLRMAAVDLEVVVVVVTLGDVVDLEVAGVDVVALIEVAEEVDVVVLAADVAALPTEVDSMTTKGARSALTEDVIHRNAVTGDRNEVGQPVQPVTWVREGTKTTRMLGLYAQ